jgi:hypothetical protein
MKKVVGFFLIGAVLLVQAVMLYAATSAFNLTATITGLTGSAISAQTVTPGVSTTVWSPLVGDGMTFDPLTLRTFTVSGTQYQAFLPNHFFAIDVSGTGGSGTPLTVINYADGESPAGALPEQTLGNRANISFRALKYEGVNVDPTETPMGAHDPVLLSAVDGKNITPEDITGALAGSTWLRMYVGINDGTTDGMLPFTPADPTGAYTGRLTITSTP